MTIDVIETLLGHTRGITSLVFKFIVIRLHGN